MRTHWASRKRGGKQNYCDSCRRLSAASTNVKDNAISKIAYSIAGSSTKFYGLPRERRRAIRAAAAAMHEAGKSVRKAEQYEETHRNGFVYIITNRAWPGCIKVGRAVDPDARLSSYQTSSPLRDFELEFFEYFEDCYAAELEMHRRFDADRLNGEWFSFPVEDAREAILDFSASLLFRTEDHSDG